MNNVYIHIYIFRYIYMLDIHIQIPMYIYIYIYIYTYESNECLFFFGGFLLEAESSRVAWPGQTGTFRGLAAWSGWVAPRKTRRTPGGVWGIALWMTRDGFVRING